MPESDAACAGVDAGVLAVVPPFCPPPQAASANAVHESAVASHLFVNIGVSYLLGLWKSAVLGAGRSGNFNTA